LADLDFVDKGEFEKFARTLARKKVFVVPLLASFFVENQILNEDSV
jgi:hypothetical protein